MKKLAVYSCITGAYDSFPAHPSICADADYYLFVGKGELPAEVPAPWKAIELDGSFPDTITAARYAKLHPHTLLSDYEYTLWMDANVGVASPEFFGTVEEKISAAVPVSGIMHPACDCAYEEGVRVVRAGRARPGQVIRILRVLRRNQFPHHFGMFETAVLLRSNTDARVRSLNILDQLNLNVVEAEIPKESRWVIDYEREKMNEIEARTMADDIKEVCRQFNEDLPALEKRLAIQYNSTKTPDFADYPILKHIPEKDVINKFQDIQPAEVMSLYYILNSRFVQMSLPKRYDEELSFVLNIKKAIAERHSEPLVYSDILIEDHLVKLVEKILPKK